MAAGMEQERGGGNEGLWWRLCMFVCLFDEWVTVWSGGCVVSTPWWSLGAAGLNYILQMRGWRVGQQICVTFKSQVCLVWECRILLYVCMLKRVPEKVSSRVKEGRKCVFVCGKAEKRD